jgi:hypothetical protein
MIYGPYPSWVQQEMEFSDSNYNLKPHFEHNIDSDLPNFESENIITLKTYFDLLEKNKIDLTRLGPHAYKQKKYLIIPPKFENSEIFNKGFEDLGFNELGELEKIGNLDFHYDPNISFFNFHFEKIENKRINHLIRSEVEGVLASKIKSVCKNSKIKYAIGTSIESLRDISLIENIGGEYGFNLSKVGRMYDESKINNLRHNTKVNTMYHKSKVNIMKENSLVEVVFSEEGIENMCDSSIVEYLDRGSLVNKMQENSKIIHLYGVVNKLKDKSSIENMWWESRVDSMHDKTEIGEMFNFSSVDKMSDDSRIIGMTQYSVVENMFNNSQILGAEDETTIWKMNDESELCRIFGSSKVLELNGNSKIGNDFRDN